MLEHLHEVHIYSKTVSFGDQQLNVAEKSEVSDVNNESFKWQGER